MGTETALLLSSRDIRPDVFDEDQKEATIHEIEQIIGKAGEVVITPSYLPEGYDIHLKSAHIHRDDTSLDKISINIRHSGEKIEDATLILSISKDGNIAGINGYYANRTAGKRIEVKGLTDILIPIDELVSQAAADHYQIPFTREVIHVEKKLLRKFGNRGFIFHKSPDPRDLDFSTKIYHPRKRQ